MVISPDFRVIMIMMVSSFAAVMLPSRLYSTMNLPNRGISYAMLPASKLEKFLSMLLYTFIVAPVVVYLGSMVIDIILRTLPAGGYHQWLWQGHWGFPIIHTVHDSSPQVDFSSGWVTAAIYSSYLASPALFLFAATLFKKHKVLYTFLILYLIEFVFSIVLIPLLVHLGHNIEFMEWLVETFKGWTPERFYGWLFGLITAFNLFVAILFTWLAWLRLKKMPY
jgi:hypothetical protein